jgi:hypothetical protein
VHGFDSLRQTARLFRKVLSDPVVSKRILEDGQLRRG